jgi:sirohydrochlorin ferrochelatase
MSRPRLLVVAHGTASQVGTATSRTLVEQVAADRPATDVDLCFLDVADPRLDACVDDRPTVVLPLLLSTGYHVEVDIPGAVAGHPNMLVARYLGPDPLVVDVLVQRLAEVRGPDGTPAATTFLVGAGSRRPDARLDLDAAAGQLGERLGRPVPVLTMADDLRTSFRAAPGPVEVATCLLTEGRFVTELEAAAAGLGRVAAPLGVHPSLVRLVWQRYDEVASG